MRGKGEVSTVAALLFPLILPSYREKQTFYCTVVYKSQLKVTLLYELLIIEDQLLWLMRENSYIGFVSAFFWHSASSKSLPSQKNAYSEPYPLSIIFHSIIKDLTW